MTGARFLDELAEAAKAADGAETALRRDMARRLAEIAQERAFAYRRLNLMRAVVAPVAAAETEEAAVAGARAILRARLDWSEDSEARQAVLSRFETVICAMFAGTNEQENAPAILEALAGFEAWYGATHDVPFFALFERVMPETPVVDF